ncbi:MAG TPA: endonuclease/exonuclease/phosphatase family protein [Oscillatoriaceae cyanobacterium M33_DOE_052]|uniref:Endonuclease/exonuclease/phosphatase family protein n=1 Tax=Planktothricoides sp. SpSt-374 TaxID=2282167 RepID=A0A7C3VNY1_9CYAN|nr:endonuclease/exonuclease/phosphatase family protein [Oscillatoriaceae cyanobacterium M33_DOE_052]
MKISLAKLAVIWQVASKNIWLLATLSFTLITLAGYFGKLHFILEQTSHLRLHYLLVNICLMVVLLWLARQAKIALAFCAFCLVINLAEIVPWYLPLWGNNPSMTGQNLRVVASNVLRSNIDYSRVISWVRQEQPDLAVFLEIHNDWSRELEKVKDILPYSLSYPQDGYYGVAIYSKLPLENGIYQEFGVKGIVSIVADVTVRGKKVTVIGTHPAAPLKVKYFHWRNIQLGEMSRYVSQLNQPTIVIGDLNITMWSPYYKDFIASTGMRNARKGFGVQPTWYKKSPIFAIPLDHCLVSPEIQVLNSGVGDNVGSDHLPIIVDLAIN